MPTTVCQVFGISAATRSPGPMPRAARRLQARHVTGQFGVAEHLAATVFAHRDQRRGIIAAAQQVFGEIQRGAGEPARRGHLRAFLEDRTRRLLEAHLEEVDDGLPERLAPLHAQACSAG